MSQLSQVKVEGRNRPRTNMSYVNPAYVDSVNDINRVGSVNVHQERRRPEPPVTEVVLEQYWACSRWPYTTRVLAITVGVLTGALIGFLIFVFLDDDQNNVISGIFKSYAPD